MSKTNKPLPFIHNEGISLTVVIDGKAITTKAGHRNYSVIVKAIDENRWNDVSKLVETEDAVKNYMEGKIQIRNGQLLYDGQIVGNTVVDRILSFMQKGHECKPLLGLLEKLMENPSMHSVEQLYKFLEHRNLPITPNGNFLGYKGLKEDYYSVHSGTNKVEVSKNNGETWEAVTGFVPNHIGNLIRVPRNQVSDNANVHCAAGLHVGSIDYATSWSQGKVVIVEVNPKNAVSVPNDCSCQKLRTCEYRVAEDYKGAMPDILHDATSIYGSDWGDSGMDWVDAISY